MKIERLKLNGWIPWLNSMCQFLFPTVAPQSEELCRLYLEDCDPEHTNDEDVTSGSVDCAPNTLQCEVDDQQLLQYLDGCVILPFERNFS